MSTEPRLRHRKRRTDSCWSWPETWVICTPIDLWRKQFWNLVPQEAGTPFFCLLAPGFARCARSVLTAPQSNPTTRSWSWSSAASRTSLVRLDGSLRSSNKRKLHVRVTSIRSISFRCFEIYVFLLPFSDKRVQLASYGWSWPAHRRYLRLNQLPPPPRLPVHRNPMKTTPRWTCSPPAWRKRRRRLTRSSSGASGPRSWASCAARSRRRCRRRMIRRRAPSFLVFPRSRRLYT